MILYAILDTREAKMLLAKLKERLLKFGLEIAEDNEIWKISKI